MVSCTERMLASWRTGETRDIHKEMMRLLLEIMANTVLSADDGTTEELKKAYERIEETLGGPGTGIQVQAGYWGILYNFSDIYAFSARSGG
jgi:cytochrome P450